MAIGRIFYLPLVADTEEICLFSLYQIKMVNHPKKKLQKFIPKLIAA